MLIRDKQFVQELAVYSKQLRTNQKLTQQELANLAAINRSQITRLEAGKTPTSKATLTRVFKALDKELDEVYQELVSIRVKFDNQILKILDLIFMQSWQEAEMLRYRAEEIFSDYCHIPQYRQGILFLNASLQYRKNWSKRTPVYIRALKVTQPDLLEFIEGEPLFDVEKLSTSCLTALEYMITRQISTGLGCLGHHKQAININKALLTAFQNEAISHEIKKLLISSIYANLAWLYSEIDDTDQALVCIEKGVAYCNETGNIRSLPYLQNLKNELTNQAL